MRFEWDERKNRLNIEKHGITLSDSWQVFERPLLIRLDERKDYGEPRWIALGDLNGTVVVLVFTKRGDTIRAISMRKGNKHERQVYQNRIKTASHGLDETTKDS
ncbi:MAG: BrnT family toxin [Nitrospira sp.]|nr:BrnT family toxin [Nitrospira sp.]